MAIKSATIKIYIYDGTVGSYSNGDLKYTLSKDRITGKNNIVFEISELVRDYVENNFDGKAVVGDVLNCPWDDNYFDYVISIGCLHHTGDFYKAVDELVRVLKPGGQGVFMVYNAFSYRQWLVNPLRTLIQCFSSGFASSIRGEEDERGMYDCNSRGEAAPATEFLGRKEIFNYMTELKTQVKIRSENIGSYFLFPLPRSLKLKLFSSYLGLDLYVNFLKEEN